MGCLSGAWCAWSWCFLVAPANRGSGTVTSFRDLRDWFLEDLHQPGPFSV